VTPTKELLVYPFSLATGFLTVTYMPYLNAYSPSNTDEWNGYGADPTVAMSNNSPESCFTAAQHGIKEYLKAMIFQSAPGGLRVYRAEYELAMDEFVQSIASVKADLTDYTNMTLPPANLAGLF